MDEKKREEIAIWRYGIIAPVLHEHRKGRMEYFRDISQKTLEVPHLGRRRYTVSALKKWHPEGTRPPGIGLWLS